MQLYNFLLVKRSILLIMFSVFIFSCGSYQYSGNINDGIYDENKNVSYQQDVVQDAVYIDKTKNSYYQTVFTEKAMEYEQVKPLNDSIFTDVENYQSVVDNDSINNNYAPWGEDIDHLTINLYRGPAYSSIRWSRLWNYPIWLNNYGYGYGSAWNNWGYGYNNYWLAPYMYPHGGFYNNFYSPFLSWGYGGWYNYHPFYSSPYHYYNNGFYQNQWMWNSSSIAYISGGRRSRNATSSRSGYSNSSSRSGYSNNNSIGDRVNNLSSSSLRDRISRVDRINSAARVKPNYYSKPVSNYGSGYKPSASNTKPASNYNYKPSGYNSSDSKPSYGSSKPSNNSGSSYNSSSSFSSGSSISKPSSSGSSGSRGGGGKSGGRSGGY